jgi:hypothetical protein
MAHPKATDATCAIMTTTLLLNENRERRQKLAAALLAERREPAGTNGTKKDSADFNLQTLILAKIHI